MGFGVKIMNFVFFVSKSLELVFLVSVENGAGVNKMTNMTYACVLRLVNNILKKTDKMVHEVFPNRNDFTSYTSV